MATNDGGPAFPTNYSEDSDKDRGMSLRDYFAGQALAGLLSNQVLLMTADANSEKSTRYVAAQYAYAVADAMLEARQATAHV